MPNSEFEIRTARVEDWEVIAEFNSRLAAETEGKSLNPETINAGARALLADPKHGRYFVATENGTVIGQIMHTREWSDWRNGEIWWLQSVYVLPEFRHRGAFRSLYQHLEQLARNSPEVIGLRLYVETHNQRAQSAYRHFGFRDAGYTVMEQIFRNDV
ncbi:MAG: GNAT family N-acetyltransferase [Planctomycetes bacterium]|nr:GNAT family N-acetyltransferase [Planctomycetota bacterium]